MSEYDLKTGDILLFSYQGNSIFSSFIKYFTGSQITHVGMVLKDPDFIQPSLKGYYVWESGIENEPDPQDNKKKLGVQITPFDEIFETYSSTNSEIYVRRVDSSENFTNETLQKIHKVVYEKPYDLVPKDFYEALEKKDDEPQKTSRFWCSALLGYIYTQCEILNKDTDWSILFPKDFSSESTTLEFKIPLSDDIKIL
tara:strand:+ start:926 stop:1519 length:594 start_codon:yes stop_codon:yes gene_type:complete